MLKLKSWGEVEFLFRRWGVGTGRKEKKSLFKERGEESGSSGWILLHDPAYPICASFPIEPP